jgi:Zn-dependent protease with chaperone function
MVSFCQAIRPFGRFFLMRLLALNLLVLSPYACHASDIRVAEPSTGLAFSAGEVSAAGYFVMQRFFSEATLSGLVGCARYCAVVNKVWETLLPVLLTQKSETKINLVVVRNPAIEAFAFADGTLLISEDFIARIDMDEAQLAFVLSHEAAHILLQHERQTLTSLLALSPSKLARTPQDIYIEMEYNYFSMSESFSFLFQQIEFEADEVGMQLAALAGYSPQLQLKFMERLALEVNESSIYVTHPPASERVRRLRDQMPLALRLFQLNREK